MKFLKFRAEKIFEKYPTFIQIILFVERNYYGSLVELLLFSFTPEDGNCSKAHKKYIYIFRKKYMHILGI
jgi:hypothetical protein